MPSALLLVIMAGPGQVLAQSTFYEAYEAGLRHLDDHRWAEARTSCQRAVELRPQPAERVKTYGLNFLRDYDPFFCLAAAETGLGLLDQAVSSLARSRSAGITPTAELDRLEQEISSRRARPEPSPSPPVEVEPTAVGRPAAVVPAAEGLLILESSPSGADVFLDGRLLATTPVELPVAPGAHRLELRSAGYLPLRQDIAVRTGERVSMKLDLRPELAAVETASPTPQTQPTAAPTRRPIVDVAPTEAPSMEPGRQGLGQPTEPPEHSLAGAGLTEQAGQTGTSGSDPEGSQPPDDEPAEPGAGQADQTAPMARSAEPGSRAGVLLIVVLAVAAALGVVVIILLLRRRRSGSLDEQAPTVATPRSLERTLALHNAAPLSDGFKTAFGPYRLLGVLGRGGMATTYLAQRRDGRSVAIKIPHEHIVDSEEFSHRFVREGSLGATIHHPNIVRIFEAGQHDGRPFITMEYIDGETLEKRMARAGAIPVREALEIARQIALALDYAHVKGIVHRDLKPENVMVLGETGVKVMDYGIARVISSPGLTMTNVYLGTPMYSAPEAITPEAVDPRSDLYSLGVILYRMLTNRPPFESSSPLELLEMHRSMEPPRLSPELEVPEAADRLVRRLMAKSKSDRYASAETLLQDLNQILNTI